MVHAHPLLAAVLVLLLSGCADHQTASSKSVPTGAVKVDAMGAADPAESGEIAGRVLDEEFQLIEGVIVSVQGTQAHTTTTQDGQFYFASVPARAYTLIFEKHGFEAKNQTIRVTARQ